MNQETADLGGSQHLGGLLRHTADPQTDLALYVILVGFRAATKPQVA